LSLVEALNKLPTNTLRLCCSLTPNATPVAQILSARRDDSQGITVAIGPEGDFSPEEEEMQLVRDGGFIPVSLGSSILRSELAAVSALIRFL
jgi:16S rRNA (uracil1498-N3)-methyltransferase